MNEDLEKVLLESSEYISLLKECPKGYFLYRGSHIKILDCQLFNSHLVDRKPVNTPQYQHDKVNETFEPKFGWKIRNGVFCYGYTSLTEFPRDLGFGQQYLCFPVGSLKFIYSPNHFDLCGYFYEKKSVTDEDIQNLIFKDDSLKEAIDSGANEGALSNEISVNAATYYLIDVKHRDVLATTIWG